MRSQRHLRFVVLLVTTVPLLAFIGCATPQPLVRLAPAAKPVVWVAGRAVLTAENDGVRVAAAFEHQDGSTLGLRVEIQNETDEPLQIDPADISFTRCTSAQRESCQTPKAVINPERILSLLAEKRSIETAQAENDETGLEALVLLSAITDVASVAGGRRFHSDSASSLAALDASGAHHDTARAGLAAQQQLWSDVALRRNTIFPGKGVGGRVFIPIHLDTKFLWLHVQAGEESFSFRFAQTVTPIASPSPSPSILDGGER